MNELQTQNTGIKKFITDHSQKITVTIGLCLVVLLVGLLTLTSNAQSVKFEEIQENSAKWQELQREINEKSNKVSLLNSEISVLRNEQKEMEERNSLLRQVFTSGKNQK